MTLPGAGYKIKPQLLVLQGLTVVSSSSFNSSEESSSVEPTGLWSNPFLGWARVALSSQQQMPGTGLCADGPDGLCWTLPCQESPQVPGELGFVCLGFCLLEACSDIWISFLNS